MWKLVAQALFGLVREKGKEIFVILCILQDLLGSQKEFVVLSKVRIILFSSHKCFCKFCKCKLIVRYDDLEFQKSY